MTPNIEVWRRAAKVLRERRGLPLRVETLIPLANGETTTVHVALRVRLSPEDRRALRRAIAVAHDVARERGFEPAPKAKTVYRFTIEGRGRL